jgi:hypothetical protein
MSFEGKEKLSLFCRSALLCSFILNSLGGFYRLREGIAPLDRPFEPESGSGADASSFGGGNARRGGRAVADGFSMLIIEWVVFGVERAGMGVVTVGSGQGVSLLIVLNAVTILGSEA